MHRSDGSGTTFVWTSYLSAVSPEWNDRVGAGTSVEWPTGLGAPGNEGVASTISSTPNSIGYVELAYALTNETNYAHTQNAEGNFVEPSLNLTQAAVEPAVLGGGASTNATTSTNAIGTQNSTSINLPAGGESGREVSLLNAPGANSYPVASFTYLLPYQDLSTNIDSIERARALVDFVEWAITDGQQFASELSHVPLPDAVVQHNMQTLGSRTFQEQPLMQQ